MLENRERSSQSIRLTLAARRVLTTVELYAVQKPTPRKRSQRRRRETKPRLSERTERAICYRVLLGGSGVASPDWPASGHVVSFFLPAFFMARGKLHSMCGVRSVDCELYVGFQARLANTE